MWEVKVGWHIIARFNTYDDAEFFARKNDPQHLLTITHTTEGV